MEIVQTVFDQLRSDIDQKLRTLEKQVSFILMKSTQPAPVSEDFLKIKEVMDSINNRISKMEYRIQSVEVAKHLSPQPTPTFTSAGLEGLLMKSINLPSPILSVKSEHNTVHPIIQRSLDIVEPDEEAVEGEEAAKTAGMNIVDEEEVEEEEEVVEEEEEVVEEEEEVVEEEEEVVEEEVVEEAEEEVVEEEVQLEEFLWKGITYYKTLDNKVFRANKEGDIEDEPFAEYIPEPKPGRLVRI